MKRRLLLAAMGAIALVGCDQSRPEEARPDSQTNLAGPALINRTAAAEPGRTRLDELEFAEPEPASAPPDPAAVTREWFAGRWSDTGNCTDAGQFAANGTYLLADGTRGMWNVQDSRLVIQNAGGRNVIRLRRTGDDSVEVINADGSVGRSIRC